MHRTKKGHAVGAKGRNLHRAELLLLEAQQDLLERRIRAVEKDPLARKLKREPNGPPLPDRTEANKRPKHDVGGSMTVEEMFNQCRKLLTQLKKNNNAGPFLAPVDPVALNCPDYFKIVTQPMDFKTITTKLRPAKRQYDSPLEFREDVRQVFKNCTLYNPIGNQIRVMGDRLSSYFESLWEKSNLERYYQKRQEGLKREREGRRAEEDGGRSRKRTRNAEYTLRKLTEIRTKMDELIHSAEQNEISRMDIDSPMNFWQKRKLSSELEKAQVSVLATIWNRLPEMEDEKTEICVEEMEEENLKELWTSVVQPLKDTEPQPKGPAAPEESDQRETQSDVTGDAPVTAKSDAAPVSEPMDEVSLEPIAEEVVATSPDKLDQEEEEDQAEAPEDAAKAIESEVQSLPSPAQVLESVQSAGGNDHTLHEKESSELEGKGEKEAVAKTMNGTEEMKDAPEGTAVLESTPH